MSAAQSAQQQNRHGDGTYATKTRGEADLNGINLTGAPIDPWADPAADLEADLGAEIAAEIAVHAATEARLDEEFAEQQRRDAEERQWGQTGVGTDSRTPWGNADVATQVAAGITVVHTPGHGGIKVSRERNLAIPTALRNASGWYEEDCESNIVGMYHPEAFPHYKNGEHDAIREACAASVKNWYPDAYTKATGIEVGIEESMTLRDRAKQSDKDAFRAAHAEEFVTLGNGDTHAPWIPPGYAACRARMDATGEERTFLMSRDEVIHGGSYGKHALVDPQRHIDVTDVVNTQPDRPWEWAQAENPPQRGDDLCIDTNGLTVSQGARARAELGRQWRFTNDDGTQTVETLGEHMKRVGVVGKSPQVDGDKVVYRVHYEGSRNTPVSKATYDALTSVVDTSDETQRAYIAKERARVRYEKAKAATFGGRDTAGIAKRDQAAADYEAAVAVHRDMSSAKDQRARAWQAERDQMRQDAMAKILTSRGIVLE
ncbi:DUF7007 domain-containing protein [Nocardioides sp. Leaf285]|uniref:DUF7007 domain-containing protein n=1 Tax=Nocardioides sp. Leaf285 TaxID=1736322 RepID=UPI0007031477|nr:hypothetical protein [Nocardioides sp. Leaf285]KQP62880.1 hypothetical protein ASF47_17870 [Nocardioides sp. Leaf285]